MYDPSRFSPAYSPFDFAKEIGGDVRLCTGAYRPESDGGVPTQLEFRGEQGIDAFLAHYQQYHFRRFPADLQSEAHRTQRVERGITPVPRLVIFHQQDAVAARTAEDEPRLEDLRIDQHAFRFPDVPVQEIVVFVPHESAQGDTRFIDGPLSVLLVGRHRSRHCCNEEHCREDRDECKYPNADPFHPPLSHLLALLTRIRWNLG